jgi:hypothetical protein
MKISTALCCAALAIGSALYAQSAADHMTVHFNTPVIVGETKIPAGECDIQVMHGSSDTLLLVVRSQAGPSAMAVVSRLYEGAGDATGITSVVLARHGNDLHLERVLLGDRSGYQLNLVE